MRMAVGGARRRRGGGVLRSLARVSRVWTGTPWRLLLADALLRLLPDQVGTRQRTRVYRAAGLGGIDPKVHISGRLTIHGRQGLAGRLSVGARSDLTSPLALDLGGRIAIGSDVTVCHHVSIMTTTHGLGPARRRAAGTTYADVHIGDGVWVGAHVVLGAGVTVGRGSVLLPGAVVLRDVPPNTMVQGNPARVITWLD